MPGPTRPIDEPDLLLLIAGAASRAPAAVTGGDVLPLLVETILSAWPRLEQGEAATLVNVAGLLCRDAAAATAAAAEAKAADVHDLLRPRGNA
jgi:hypothetical protein